MSNAMKDYPPERASVMVYVRRPTALSEPPSRQLYQRLAARRGPRPRGDAIP
jgi:hypothetical protein